MIPSLSVVQTVPSRRRNDAPALSSPPKPSDPSTQPVDEPLEPDRHLEQPAAEAARRRGRSCCSRPASCRRATSRAPARGRHRTGSRSRPTGSGSGSCSPAPGVTMPWRSASVSLPNATSNRSRSATRRAIAYGDDGSIRIFPSQSTVMKPNVGSTIVVRHGQVEAVAARRWRPSRRRSRRPADPRPSRRPDARDRRPCR